MTATRRPTPVEAPTERRHPRSLDLDLLRAAMIEAGHDDEAHLATVDAEAAKRAEEIRDGVAEAPEPDGSELFTHVFRETTEELARQHRTWQEEVEL